ncbi:MAG: MotA/TolQ/ExbB proton channel family protein [Bacteroidales bacterium]
MEKQKKQKRSIGVSALWIIIGCAIIAFCFFFIICGNTSNFDEKGHPIAGNIFGTLYQGGYVIPVVITLLLTVLALSIERAIALNKAKGKGKLIYFVDAVKQKLQKGKIEEARKLCDEQQGSVSNILTSALLRYEDVERQNISNDEKAALIAREIEDATTLELPAMEQNLSIIAVISSLGTLMGLLGTVLGMIKSFGAMGQEGAPDSTALAIGISEALLNTAMGIATGALAIISYNYFSGKVQNMTNFVNEIGFTIGQLFTKKDLHL